jgi:hypothetical protein
MITKTCRVNQLVHAALKQRREKVLHPPSNVCTPNEVQSSPPGEPRLSFGVGGGLYLHLCIITEREAYSSKGVSHRCYYEGPEAPDIAASCGCGELLGDRPGGRGESGRPEAWPCRDASELATWIPSPRTAARLDARDRDEGMGSSTCTEGVCCC